MLTDDETDFGRALAHYCRALILEEELGRTSAESLEHFITAAELDPGQPQLHAKAAIAYQATGQNDKAIEEFKKAIKLSPGTTPLYLELATTYFLLDRDSEALKILRKGLRKADRPGVILVFCYNCGVRYIITKQIARAIPCFEIIARNDPSKTQQFYELLGELYAQLGYEEEYIRHFILATKSDPPNPNPFLKLAALYMKTDPAKAIETLNQAASIMPNDPVIFFFLGLVYTDQKQFDKAILEFQKTEKAVEESDKEEKLNADFYLHYGAAYEQSGQIEKAEEVFEKGLKLYPQAHQVLNYLAYMWAEKGIKLEKGLEYITQALELEPDNAAYIDTLGWICYKSKKYKEALEQIRKANDLIKNDPTMIDHLGDIFEALNDREKAILHWKQSFLLDPENKAVATKLETHGVNLDQLRKEAENLKESPQKGVKSTE